MGTYYCPYGDVDTRLQSVGESGGRLRDEFSWLKATVPPLI